MSQIDKRKVRKTAEEHVDWLLRTVRELMVTEFEHGYKHGWEDAKAEKEVKSRE